MNKNLTDLVYLTRRHIKLYFKDKVTFFMSLITPMILIVLFVTFLKSVYISSLKSILPDGTALSDSLINGFAAGWLISSIFATTPVTLAFCSNTIMIEDKISKSVNDFKIAPTSKVIVSLSYFLANFLITMIICLICLALGLGYIALSGWYLSGMDIALILGALALTALLGSLLASICEYFVASQGGASAFATLVSSMYGFVCGAYMPISQFSSGIKAFVSFIPGTYATVLFRRFFMRGVFEEMAKTVSPEYINGIKDGFDNNFYFNGNLVGEQTCFLVLAGSIMAFLFIYILIVLISSRSWKRRQGALGPAR